jgi:hypothetical protein
MGLFSFGYARTAFALFILTASLANFALPVSLAMAQDGRDASATEGFVSECPPASRLLPGDTLAYMRIRDVTSLKTGFANSTLGKMLDDPAMQPFVSDTYQTVSEVLEEVASEIGLSLDELLAIPRGQVAMALVPGMPADEEPAKRGADEAEETDEEVARRMQRQRRNQNNFAGVFIIETGTNNDSQAKMRELLNKISELATKNQFVQSEEAIGDHSLISWKRPRGDGPVVESFDRDGVFVIGIGRRTAADVLERWNETDAPKNRKEAAARSQNTSDSTELLGGGNLSSNPDFGAVMTRSVSAETETPQITFFVNPYAIAQKIIRRSGSSFFILPIVEELGAQKIRGFGGSVFRGGDIVETIVHVHVVIDPPRDGFFGVVRPEPTEPSPPVWVPADATNYLTSNWDIATATDNLSKIVSRFAGEGAFERFTEDQIKARLDVSLKDDLIANLTGRYVGVRRYQSPAAWNAIARCDALQVRDIEKARAMLDKIRTKLPAEDMRPETIGGTQVYFARRSQELPDTLRQPERSVMLLDDYLILSDSREIVEQIIKAHVGGTARLIDDQDYALMVSELGAKLAGEEPFLLTFNRDADNYRVLYDMAASPTFADSLMRRGERRPTAKKFADLLQRQKMPSFDDLRQYFNVSGSFAYDEPGGLHFGTMNLRPLE